MTKTEFLRHVAALYACGNLSDHDSNTQEWTKPEMAGSACCGALDDMLRAMKACEALSADEHQEFYDSL